MPLPGLNFGRALASAAGAAQNQRGALATLIGVWGGGRDYRTSGGGTDYRVAAAQKAEAERQQYEQEQADKFAKDEADFEQQKQLEKIRFDNQKELQRLRPSRAGKVTADGSLIPKPLTLPEVKYAEEKAKEGGDAAIDMLPVFSSMPFSQRPSFSEEKRKERKDALDRQDRIAKEAVKPPPVALQKFQQEEQARAADDVMGELPVFSSMPFAQRPAFSEQQKKERKIERDRQEKIAKEERDRAQHVTDRAAPSGRDIGMAEISKTNQQLGRVEADKIRDENARVTREQKVQDMGAKAVTDKAKAEARSREIAVEKRRKVEDNAVKAGQDRAQTEMRMALTLASMHPELPKSKATVEKFNALAQKYTDEARTTGLDNFAISEVKGLSMEEVRDEVVDLTTNFASGRLNMTREQYNRLMKALAERQKELE